MNLSDFDIEGIVENINKALVNFNIQHEKYMLTLEKLCQKNCAKNGSADTVASNTENKTNELTNAGRPVKEKSKMKVKIKIAFLKIGVIDTIKNKFNAEVLVTTKWRKPEVDGKKKEVKLLSWEGQWTPSMVISNIVGEVKVTTSYNVIFDNSGRAVACETKKFVGHFFENMELYDFPFDKQDLTICASSEKTVDELELIEDENDPCVLNLKAFSAEQEWALNDNLNKWNKLSFDYIYQI
ncbi:hypothetical protein HELRODRAFT_161281 [Helobdella robusta]|uniref:Neurotransmitter-gated ion-channel ligand-binding domain-containing protein n=1 Tax=Helobdella robusta TaxID=6412 RepID=T1ERA3_HELRO|nr:hypothetical protein HELRODRAFT_161281 [Helobdella robusta]ESO02053.1 hypothetical protein HELRODRAFT_161281 [Helobdella robusta]